MRNSLTELYLEYGMLSSRDYILLCDFKQLKKLHVGENVLKNIYECEEIWKHPPKLTEFRVEGLQLCDDLEDNLIDRGDTTPATNYSNIENLDFKYLIDWGDKEMRYIMSIFTKLTHLSLSGKFTQLTTAESLSTSCMKSFIQFLSNMEYSHICFYEANAEWLMDMHPTDQNGASRQDNCQLHLSIRLLNVGFVFKSHKLFQTRFVRSSYDRSSTVEFLYSMTHGPVLCKSSILDNLTHVHKNVQKVEVNWNKHQIETGEYIIAILAQHIGIATG